jgi:multiple sugar transport system permease protein
MTDQLTARPVPVAAPPETPAGNATRTRRRRTRDAATAGRSISSPAALRSRRGRATYWTGFGLLASVLTIVAAGPLLWMVTGAFKTTPELVNTTPSLLPEHPDVGNFGYAWNTLEVPRYLLNTVLLAAGGLVAQMVIAVSSAYTFSILKPAGHRLWFVLMTATLFVPATVIFIPTYVTIVDLNLINNPLAVWLPQAASAFNIFILKQFFDRIDREVLDAANVDGASSWQLLRHIVLPMSRPILAVIAIFSVIASWKDFLWPKITLPDPNRQPLSVALDLMQHSVELKYVLAALVIASIPPIVIFLIFQRRIVGGLTDAGINR